MLFLIGLGLGDIKDITVKGLEIVKKAQHVILEHYTSILYDQDAIDKLEEFYGRKIELADRYRVENDADGILDKAVDGDIAFLVVGDPLGATTHTDLILRAVKRGIRYKIIHNASIMNAVGCSGLQLYNFGETVSIPLWTFSWRPNSFIEKIVKNMTAGLHTLCLLDIKVKEKTEEALIKNKEIYEPPRFMTTSQAATQILEAVEELQVETLTKDSFCIGLSRVGSDDQKIVRCRLHEMTEKDLGKPLHCLIIEGRLHPIEQEMLELFTD